MESISTPPVAIVPDAQTAALAAPAGNSTQPTMSTTISSLADLKKQAPQLYKAMMLGLAQTIIASCKVTKKRS